MAKYLTGIISRTGLLTVAIAFIGTSIAWAAITGSISGVVTDPTGQVVRGVTVVATSISTNVQHTTVTDSEGFYSFPTLNVDIYNVTASEPGFRNFLETAVKIDTNSAVRIDIKLELGAVSNTVTVKSDVLQVETQSSQMGVVIEGSKIVSMPLNGRSYIDLLALQPGISPYTGDSTTGGVGTLSINGGRPNSNAFMINGADAEEKLQNGAGIIPNLDSIAEFRVVTNNFNAEFGNYSGGQVVVVTKSGANQYHGDVFDFLRNTDLDAKNYFSSNRGAFIQNQFGGTIGGPIKRNKSFFFGDYQGTKQTIGQAVFFPVPSVTDRSGDLTDQSAALLESDPANGGQGVVGTYWANILSERLGYSVTAGEPYYTQGCTATTDCVFPNAIIPQAAWSPVAMNTLKYIPSPNVPGQNAFETSAFAGTLSENKGGIRVDMNTRFGSLFGYYFTDRTNSINPYGGGNVPGFASANMGLSELVNVGLTTNLNTSTVNDARLVYLRLSNLNGTPIGGLGVTLASLGFNTPFNDTGGIGPTNPAQEGVPVMRFNNFILGAAQGQRQVDNTMQGVDNVTKIVGTHAIQFGGDFHYNQVNLRTVIEDSGRFRFSGAETGLDFADFLLGAPNFLLDAAEQVLDSRSQYYGVYAQDSWRVRPTITMNYGLRYEIATPWYDSANKLSTLIPGQQSEVFTNAPLGLLFPGDKGVPRGLSPIRYTNFAPRFGINFAPDVEDGLLHRILGAPGKTSIRAGYGLFYSAMEGYAYFYASASPPYGYFYQSPVPPLLSSPFIDRATGHFEGIKFPFTFPPSNVSPQHPATYDFAQLLPLSGIDFLYPKNRVPYVQNFELSIQRQLGTSTVLTISYVGTTGRELTTSVEANPGDAALCLSLSKPADVAPGSPTCGPFGEQNVYTRASGEIVNSTRPTFGSNFGSVDYIRTEASSSYNSFQANVTHNDKYVNFLVGYTYSKSMDNNSGLLDGTNPFNPDLSRSLSIFDNRNVLVASYLIQLPFNKLGGDGTLSSRFTAGWAVSGISTFASGQPITLQETDDRSLAGVFVTPVPAIDVPSYANNGSHLYVNRNPRKGQPYFNPNYFVQEPLGQFGNVMRRFFPGPGILNTDMALLKNTRISERTQLQFRAEAFNVFNHAQFNNPSGNFNNTGIGGFGYVTSALDPRIMQVALKLIF